MVNGNLKGEHTNMNVFFDILIVVVILFSVMLGARRGLVKSVLSIASFIFAFIAARIFSPQLSDYLYSRFIYNSFVYTASEQIERFLTPNIDLNTLANNPNPPENFVSMIQGYGFNVQYVQNWIRQAGADNTEFVAAQLAEPVARQVSFFVAFLIILVVVLILFKIAGNIIDSLVNLPGLNILNKTGGMVIGLIYGLALCWITVFLASYVMPYLMSIGTIDSWYEIRESTLLFRWFHENSPIPTILGRG